jgi:hypothetical protein
MLKTKLKIKNRFKYLFALTLAASLLLTTADSFCADKGKQKVNIDLSAIPVTAFYGENLILRTRVIHSKGFAVKDAEYTLSFKNGKNSTVIENKNFRTFSRNRRQEVVFTVNTPRKYKNKELHLELKNKDRKFASSFLHIIDLTSQQKEVILKQNQLYHKNDRAILMAEQFNEALYRKWLIPRKIKSIADFPDKQDILFINSDPEMQSIEKYMTGENIKRLEFHTSNHKKNYSTPALAVLCKTYNLAQITADSIIIYPGIADIKTLTSYEEYSNYFNFLLLLLEARTKQKEHTQLYLVIPDLPPLMKNTGKKYLNILKNISAKHHINIVSESKIIKKAGIKRQNAENFYHAPDAEKKLAQIILTQTSFKKEKQLLKAATACFAILLLIFIWIQLRTHNRLKKLIAVSIGK